MLTLGEDQPYLMLTYILCFTVHVYSEKNVQLLRKMFTSTSSFLVRLYDVKECLCYIRGVRVRVRVCVCISARGFLG